MRKELKILISAVLIVIFSVASFYVGQATVPVVTVSPRLSGEIPIGIIAASGEEVPWYEAVVKIIEPEVNAFVEAAGYDVTFKFLVENAELSEVKALEKVESLVAIGVQVISGFLWSSHLKNCMSYVNDNHIIVIAAGASSPLLAVPDDYVFRLNPDDRDQGKVIAKAIADRGIKAIFSIQHGSSWGDPIHEAVKTTFETLGGVVGGHIRYDPKAREFSAEVSELNTKINELIETYGKDKVGVVLLCGSEEGGIIMNTAHKYPILDEVEWFGSEGSACSAHITDAAGEAAAKQKQISTMWAVVDSPEFREFSKKFYAETGVPPTAQSVIQYDCLWLAVLSTLSAGEYDGETIKNVIPTVASMYYGLAGLMKLNEAGDRSGTDYDLWGVIASNGKYVWAKVGYYSLTADEFEWYKEPIIPG